MAKLVECLLSVHNTLGSFHLQSCINRVWWQLPEIPELWMKRQEKQKFRIILSYRACLRPGWAHETLYPRKESERGKEKERRREGGRERWGKKNASFKQHVEVHICNASSLTGLR